MSNRYTVQNLKRQIEQLYISNAELNDRLKELEASLSESLGRETKMRLALTFYREMQENFVDGDKNAAFYLGQMFYYVKKEHGVIPSSLLDAVEKFFDSLDDEVVLDDFNYFA